jgi:hypothetical protein
MRDIANSALAVKRHDCDPDVDFPENLTELWASWLEARDRAWQSGELEDAVHAGRLWAAFLFAFHQPPLTAIEK